MDPSGHRLSSAAQNQAVTGLVIIRGKEGVGRETKRENRAGGAVRMLGQIRGRGPWQSRPRSTFSPITENLGFVPLG